MNTIQWNMTRLRGLSSQFLGYATFRLIDAPRPLETTEASLINYREYTNTR